MNTPPAEEEIFDDIHSGVAALQDLARTESLPLTPTAVATMHRLESTVPSVRGRLRRLKEALKENASRAAVKTDQIIHDYPWFFTLGALTLGVLAGLAIAGSRDEGSD